MGRRNKKKKKKTEINYYFLIIGLLILIPPILFPNERLNREDVTQINISLHSDIKTIKGRKGNYSYKFWSKEYKSEFVINRGSTPNHSYSLMKNLKENDVLTISIKNKNRANLKNKIKRIPIYSMSTKNSNIFSLKEFNEYNKMYDFRLNVITGFIGLLMILNSFSLLSKYQNYFLVGSFAFMVLLMRVFRFGIY